MRSKTIVSQFYHALCDDDESSALNHLSAEVRWCAAHPVNDRQGHEQFLTDYWRPIKTALPDIEYKPFIMLAGEYEGRQWVDSTGYFIGTFTQPLFDIPPTGKTLYLRFAEMACIEHNRITECYIIPDFLDAMHQAGVNPVRPALGHDGLIMPPSSMDGLHPDHATAEQSEKSLRLVKAMLAGLARYDGKSLLSMQQEKFWRPHFMWYGPAGVGATRGLQGFREHHQGPFLAAFPDRSVDGYLNYVAEGNYVATGGWPHMSARHTGDGWLGLPASNKALTLRVMDFWRCEGERLCENWVSIDMTHLLRQMGHDVFQPLRDGQVPS